MTQKFPIDSAWFVDQMRGRGKSLRGLARFMDMDAAAVSRMLNGQRNMSAAEQDKVAAFLGVGISEIAVHRGTLQAGFGEKSQERYTAGTGLETLGEARMFTEADIIYKDGERWVHGPEGLLPLDPLFGCMKGSLLIPEDLDPTTPIEFEWGGKLYNE